MNIRILNNDHISGISSFVPTPGTLKEKQTANGKVQKQKQGKIKTTEKP